MCLQAKITAACAHKAATLFQATPDFLSFPVLAGATKQEGQGDVYQAQPAHAHTVSDILLCANVFCPASC